MYLVKERKTHQRGRRRVKREETHTKKKGSIVTWTTVFDAAGGPGMRRVKTLELAIPRPLRICHGAFAVSLKWSGRQSVVDWGMRGWWGSGGRECRQLLQSIALFFFFQYRWHSGKNSHASAWAVGDVGSVPGSGRSPGEGNGNPLQFSCLGIPMDRGAWWAGPVGSQEPDRT